MNETRKQIRRNPKKKKKKKKKKMHEINIKLI